MPELHVYSRPELPGFDEALKELQEAIGALPGTDAAPRKAGQAAASVRPYRSPTQSMTCFVSSGRCFSAAKVIASR